MISKFSSGIFRTKSYIYTIYQHTKIFTLTIQIRTCNPKHVSQVTFFYVYSQFCLEKITLPNECICVISEYNLTTNKVSWAVTLTGIYVPLLLWEHEIRSARAKKNSWNLWSCVVTNETCLHQIFNYQLIVEWINPISRYEPSVNMNPLDGLEPVRLSLCWMSECGGRSSSVQPIRSWAIGITFLGL